MISLIAKTLGVSPFAVTAGMLALAALGVYGYGWHQYNQGWNAGEASVEAKVAAAREDERVRQEKANTNALAAERIIIRGLLDQNKSLEERLRENSIEADKDQRRNSTGVSAGGVRRIDSIH